MTKSQSAGKGWDQAGGASQRGGKPRRQAVRSPGMRPGVTETAGSVRPVCVGGARAAVLVGTQRPVLSRLTCLGASWEPQPWLLDLPRRDCASGQMPPTPTPCRTCEGAEQSPHARWSGCQVPTWALKPCLHVVLHPGGRMAESTADTLQAGGGPSPVELAGPHR